MRPASIDLFDKLYLTSFAISVVQAAVSFNESAASLQADPATARFGFGSGFLIAMLLISFSISFLLWFLIARRASNVAKWILVILTAISVPMLAMDYQTIAASGAIVALLTAIATVLSLCSIFCLYRRDARDWFASRGRSGRADPAIFE
jgi:hypothetical protein